MNNSIVHYASLYSKQWQTWKQHKKLKQNMILHRLHAPRMIQAKIVWCVPFTAEIRSFENKVSIAFSCACAGVCPRR